MKKTLLFGGIMNLLFMTTNAQTSVSGNISTNTIWNTAGSPYTVTDHIYIDAGVSLQIDPGVTVQFAQYKAMFVNGELIANGTVSDSIMFTSTSFVKSHGYWSSIYFTENCQAYNSTTQTGCQMTYCTVEAGGAYYWDFVINGLESDAALMLDSKNILLEHCAFETNFGAIEMHGLTAPMAVKHCRFNENYSDSGGGHPSAGVLFFDETGTDTLTLSCNLFYNNYLMIDGLLDLRNQTICSYNVFAGHSSGTLVRSWDSIIELHHNQFIDNRHNLIWSDGSINYNTFNRNEIPVSSYMISNLDSMNVYNYNNFFGNYENSIAPGMPSIFQNGVIRQWANSPATDATNNYWGSVSNADIDEMIYDFSDDANRTVINYLPALSQIDPETPVTPVTNLLKTDMGGGTYQLSWSANPDPDVVGYKVYFGASNGYSYTNSVDVGNTTTHTLTGLSATDKVAVTAYDADFAIATDECYCHESWFTSETSYGSVVGLNEASELSHQVSIYPNPLKNEFVLHSNELLQDASIELYDIQGVLVQKWAVKNNNMLVIKDLNLATGIYYLNIQDSGKIFQNQKISILK